MHSGREAPELNSAEGTHAGQTSIGLNAMGAMWTLDAGLTEHEILLRMKAGFKRPQGERGN